MTVSDILHEISLLILESLNKFCLSFTKLLQSHPICKVLLNTNLLMHHVSFVRLRLLYVCSLKSKIYKGWKQSMKERFQCLKDTHRPSLKKITQIAQNAQMQRKEPNEWIPNLYNTQLLVYIQFSNQILAHFKLFS